MKAFVLGLMLIFSLQELLAQQTTNFVISSVKPNYDLSKYLYFWADSTQQFSIEQVKNKLFLPVTTNFQTKDATQNTKINGVYWYKIIINNQQSYTTKFVLVSSVFEVKELYIFDTRKQLKTQQITTEGKLHK